MGKKKTVTKETPLGKLLKSCKIESLPKTVQDSIPYTHVFNDGIIETRPGNFTIEFKLEDVNFQIATDESQMEIFSDYMTFLNSFDKEVKWQILLQNHFISREDVLKKIRMAPQQDGLNVYRQEMNAIQIKMTATGKSSIEQSKYLVVSIEDVSYENVKNRLEKIESNVDKYLGKLTETSMKRMSTTERLAHLYTIYNQDENVEPFIGNSEFFSFDNLAETGLITKDIIGPSSIDYRRPSSYMIGDMYAKSYFVKKMPSRMTTSFLSDITDIPCSMLVSMKFEPSDPEETVSAVRSQLASIEGQVAAKQKANAEQGMGAFIPPELEKAYEHAKALMDDVLSSNQKLFFMSFTITLFAPSEEQLKTNETQLITVGSTHQTPIKPLKDQMEAGFNSTLPLCVDETLEIDRQYTTENASVFIPFTSQELNQDNAIFYGLNSTTQNMILYDRLSGNNYNALIFGKPGTGKSFTTKIEIVSVLLNKKDAQVFVIDPQEEYYPLANNLHGKVIDISPTSQTHINPLDMDINYDEDPIAAKTDFVLGMLSIMVSNPAIIDNGRSAVDRCVRRIYTRYLDALRDKGVTNDISVAPTLADLYQELLRDAEDHGDYMAEQIAGQMEMYVYGSYHTFAHRTNVDIKNERFVVYNTKKLGSGMKELGLHVCLNDVWNRMIDNSKKHVYTYFYIDEFHILLHNRKITDFLVMIWKMARKWLGCPCGIMQNTEDLLRDDATRNILNTTSFIIMFSEEKMDRDNLQILLKLSDAQLKYITNNAKGHGLIYTGKIVLPFEFDFPKNTKLYALMTTSHDVKDAQFA